MTWRWRASALALAVALCFGAATLPARLALAEPTAADRENARVLWQEGLAKRGQNEHAAALAAFEAADALMALPVTGIEVAREREALGLLIEARDIALSTAKRQAGTPEDERARAEALALYERLGPRIATLALHITGPSPGVKVLVRIDGVELPEAAAAAPRRVNPGTHTVRVEASGYVAGERKVLVAESSTAQVDIDLRPALPEPPPTTTLTGAAPPPSASWPAEAGIVRLHIQTDDLRIQIYRLYDVSELPPLAGARRSQVSALICQAPCDRIIDGRSGRFYFGGSDLPSSRTFALSGLRGDARADVRAGSDARKTGGAVLLVGGLLGVVGGLGALGAGSLTGDDGAILGGGLGLGFGAVMSAVAGYLLGTSSTRFELSPAPAAR